MCSQTNETLVALRRKRVRVRIGVGGAFAVTIEGELQHLHGDYVVTAVGECPADVGYVAFQAQHVEQIEVNKFYGKVIVWLDLDKLAKDEPKAMSHGG